MAEPTKDNQEMGNGILSDELYLHPKTKETHNITLYSNRIECISSKQPDKKRIKIPLADITGCDCLKGERENDIESYFSIYCYQHKKKVIGNTTARQRRVITLMFNNCSSFLENSTQAQKWKTALQNLLKRPDSTISNSSKKWLFLINPKSGPGKALSIFQQRVIPVLAEAGVDYKVVVTDHAGHGEEIMKKLRLEDWYCVVIISGDGLIYETFNGLMKRGDWKTAIKFPVGCLPGGSGNALSCALSHAAGEPYLEAQVLHACYVMLKHKQLPLDLVALETGSGERLYSFLSVAWGLISDVDIESEKYRSLGNFRFTLGAVVRIMGLKKYRGRVSFLPDGKYMPRNIASKLLRRSQSEYQAPNTGVKATAIRRGASTVEEGQDQMSHTSLPSYHGDASSTALDTENTEEGLVKPQFNLDETRQEHEISANDVINETGDGNTGASTGNGDVSISGSTGNEPPELDLLVPLSKPVPDSWITIEDEFVTVLAVYLSHLGPDLIVDPNFRFDGGRCQLTIVHKNATRAGVMKLFLSMADGTAEMNNDMIETVNVRAFRIEPLTEKGVLAVDGEVVDYGPIQGQVLPGLANIMGIEKRA